MADARFPNFTCTDASGVDLWPETPSQGWGADNALGRERAAELIAVVRRTDNPALLGHVVEAIARRGTIGGVETGFFHELSLALMQPAVREMVEVPVRRPCVEQLGHLRVVSSR